MVSALIFLSFDHFAATQAGGADAHALGGSAHASVYGAQVHVPAPLGDVVGVADAVSRLRLLAADFTLLSHDCCRSFQGLWMECLFYRILGVGDKWKGWMCAWSPPDSLREGGAT